MIKKILITIFAIIGLGVITIALWPEKTYMPYKVSDAYQARVDAITMPDFPKSWQWQRYEAKDGTQLRWGRTAFNKNAKATIVLIPGYTSTLEHFAEHLNHWDSQGYNVVGIDLRGQGGSDRPLANPEKHWIDSFSTYAQDIDGLLTNEIIGKPDVPVIIVASSLGAHVAYRTIGDYQTNVAGMVLNAPAFKPRLEPSNGVAKTVIGLLSVLGKGKAYGPEQSDWKPLSEDMNVGDACSDYLPRYNLHDALAVKNPELRMGAATNKWVSEMLKSGALVTKPGYADKINIPVHMLLVPDDGIVFNEPPKRVCTKNSNCSFEYVTDTRHCILYGPDAAVAKVYGAVDDMAVRTARP